MEKENASKRSFEEAEEPVKKVKVTQDHVEDTVDSRVVDSKPSSPKKTELLELSPKNEAIIEESFKKASMQSNSPCSPFKTPVGSPLRSRGSPTKGSPTIRDSKGNSPEADTEILTSPTITVKQNGPEVGSPLIKSTAEPTNSSKSGSPKTPFSTPKKPSFGGFASFAVVTINLELWWVRTIFKIRIWVCRLEIPIKSSWIV
jgi:hypothetical protein